MYIHIHRYISPPPAYLVTPRSPSRSAPEHVSTSERAPPFPRPPPPPRQPRLTPEELRD